MTTNQLIDDLSSIIKALKDANIALQDLIWVLEEVRDGIEPLTTEKKGTHKHGK